MSKLQYPRYVMDMERREQMAATAKKKKADRMARQNARAKARQERTERRADVRKYSKNVPFILRKSVGDMDWWAMLYVVMAAVLVGINMGIYHINKEVLDFATWNPKENPFILTEIGGAVMALIWLGQILRDRNNKIHDAAKSVKYSSKRLASQGDTAEMMQEYWFLSAIEEYDTGEDVVKRRVWEREYRLNPIYFEYLIQKLSGEKKNDIPPAAAVAIIENHLKSHPADIKRVMEVYDINTIPKKLLAKCGKQR